MTWKTCITTIHSSFSTHILTRKMTWLWWCYRARKFFNSHPHKEDDLRLLPICPVLSLFQLTSSQGGWLPVCSITSSSVGFSTHILTRRMTILFAHICTTFPFSTHILTRRMTGDPDTFLRQLGLFNSHPHKEDDYTFHFGSLLSSFFNSHPHKEDDLREQTGLLSSLIFNSHPHKEDDTYPNCQGTPFTVFNSHPHKEDDYLVNSSHFCSVVFNSHPHKEDDLSSSNLSNLLDFSTHILTRRMTLLFSSLNYSNHFQLTSSQGGWHSVTLTDNVLVFFQLTSSQGGWRMVISLFCSTEFFNSHPHKEDDGMR